MLRNPESPYQPECARRNAISNENKVKPTRCHSLPPTKPSANAVAVANNSSVQEKASRRRSHFQAVASTVSVALAGRNWRDLKYQIRVC